MGKMEIAGYYEKHPDMDNIDVSNFYMDKESLTSLQNDFEKKIEELRECYFNLEKKINYIEQEELWQGKSFTEFKKDFNSWKLKYLNDLVNLIQVKDLLKDVIATDEILISSREELIKCLEV